MRVKYQFPMIVMVIVLIAGMPLLCGQAKQQPIDRWLVLGPAKITEAEVKLHKSSAALLNFAHIPLADLYPVQGESVDWASGDTQRWRVTKTLDFHSTSAAVLYLAAYLETDRWLQARLLVDKGRLEEAPLVYLDGETIKTKDMGGRVGADVELSNRKHILLLKVVLPKDETVSLRIFLENKEPFQDESVHISLIPRQRVCEENILNTISVSAISLSPNGRLAAVTLSQTEKPTGTAERWLEILDTRSGKTVFSSKNLGSMDGFRWLKDSGRFSYTKFQKEKTAIFVCDLSTLEQRCILSGIKDFSTYRWADDNTFLIYTTFHKEEHNEGFKHIKEIQDRTRFAGYRYRTYIHFPIGAVTRQAADLDHDFSAAEIAPDSKQVLLLKYEEDDKNRPYRKTVAHLFDVKTFATEKLLETNWLNDFIWSPDSKKILMLGGPSSFDGIGKNPGEGQIPNDYDVQAYIYDLNQPGKVEAISKQFQPSILSASWCSPANAIYFKVTDRSNQNLYRYSVNERSFRKLNTRVDAVDTIAFARDRGFAVYWGSSANVPHKLYKIDLTGGSGVLLKDFNRDSFKYTRIGRVVPWDFKTDEGKTIVGRIHYPVDFDKSKKYPCIVYYYGGTGPVERDFGGRYPFNWYTAKGYIVYVLQPSGAVGFGQEFSALHVNDWGKTTSEEILTGVKKLLADHPYIDGQALGAMGASYGGFLTQYLAAQTDMFAAFISHAGISSLSSYWGTGDWGYNYSGIATADSFPWNRKDIYVGHSPLFLADRITRPILLLHGDIDNNVPPGESYQMFTALKLLGKEVAFVTFAGQSHWILEYKKRLRWMHTIIAWFDKHLKKQPQHWQHMYPEK